MNSEFSIENLTPKIAQFNISLSSNAFPIKTRQRVTFTSKAPLYLLNAIRGSLLEYATVKHLVIDEKSFICTDKSIISVVIFDLVRNIIVDSNVPVGAQYKYSVKNPDGYMMLQAANFVPVSDTGAIARGFEQSTMFGYLSSGASIEFMAYVEEKMGINVPGKSAVKAVESTCYFYNEAEYEMFGADDGVEVLWEKRYEVYATHKFSFVHHGQSTAQKILESAKSQLITYLRDIDKLAITENFRREILFGATDKDYGYEWMVYEPRPIAVYLIQAEMAKDPMFQSFAVNNDYTNSKIYFRLFYKSDVGAMIASIKKKIATVIALIGDFNSS